ncbi:VTT domain-containing protein [Streptococcus henryi]|uniref:VTT domain-containing protein n=1 Tax=Streptococcus henryi TaxID=439219 RepID=UPI000362D500|nr:VTT domain-containing protein [Streptococcus henryi]
MYVFWKKFFKGLSIFSILLTITFLVYLVRGLDILKNPEALSQLLTNRMLLGAFAFLLLQIIQVVIPIIPGGVTTVVGFMAFGPVLGFILNYVGIVLGSIILFALTRHYGKMFILLFIDDKTYYHYERRLFSPTYERFFILNMISPLAPADVMVMITGLSEMSYRKFLTIILICKPISILAYGYFWIYGGKFLFK